MKNIARKIFGSETFQVGSFLRGLITGASLMLSCAVFIAASHPLSVVEFAYDGFSGPGLTKAGENRVDRATGRFVEALVLAEEHHAQETLNDDVVDRMLNTALHQLDPHSGYLTKAAANAFTDEGTKNDTPRLGVTIMDVDGKYVIESVMPGSPAEIVGLMPGDRVVRVDDRYVGDEPPRAVNDIIHDEIQRLHGETIRLGIRRPGQPREISIDVDPKPVQMVGAHDLGREDGVVHIYLERFYQGAAEDVANILRREKRQGGLQGAIIDLRNNGGGLTSEARALASMFLPKGSLLYEMRGRVVGVKTIRSEDKPEFPNLRLSVIVNGYSASASEIFSGAIQAHGRGKVVGWTTLGKGSIQRVYPVEDGAVKITVAEYRDGGLRKINKVGVTPDIPIPGKDPKFRPSRFSKDEARDRARMAAAALPYASTQ